MDRLPPALAPDLLHRPCPPEDVPFETTADAEPVADIVGQERAVEAVRFGLGMRCDGYNLFAPGPPGIGKQTLLRQLLDREAASAPTPPDWCYVHNFAAPDRPRALRLPPGTGVLLRADMERAVAALRVEMSAAFDGDEYRTRKQKLVKDFKERQEQAFQEVHARALAQDVAAVRTPDGLVLAPLADGKPLDAAGFEQLPEAARARAREAMDRVGEEFRALFGRLHEAEHRHHDELEGLDRETAAAAARRVLEPVRARHAALPAVLAHLADVEKDVVAHADEFVGADGGEEEESEGLEEALALVEGADGVPALRRCAVNVLVDNGPLAAGGSGRGAPIVYEDHPTCANLVGRVEHRSRLGALVTDFTLVKPGALHRASGGYLLLDAERVLQSPFAWDALKRALRSGEIRIESPADALGLGATVSLEPEPVPLAGAKVVLVGERLLHYLLWTLDPDFPELFKVVVDLEDSMQRRPHTHALYARLVATLARKERLRPFDRGAVARVVEHAARLAEDAERLTMHLRLVVDVLREADWCAAGAGREVATAADVEAALEAARRRAGRVRDLVVEEMRRGTMLVETAGERVAQVNGLSVVEPGVGAFGHPTRITARVRAGKGEVVDIEREVELGGPLHSKGVLILAGFLGGRYATQFPLTLRASLVFEQSYGFVEGDSASLAEACALLSALADAPVRQSLAVTGSVDQHGRVQPVGGVNEKIEGFFDVCVARGLAGDQGVLVPAANVKNLMLRRDVVAAVREGRFRVFAVAEVDEAMALLTGLPPGARGPGGRFPAGSVNARVESRLVAMAESAREFSRRG